MIVLFNAVFVHGEQGKNLIPRRSLVYEVSKEWVLPQPTLTLLPCSAQSQQQAQRQQHDTQHFGIEVVGTGYYG